MEEEILEIKEEDQGIVYKDGYFVNVFFSSSHKSYYFHTYDETLKKNTKVVVETVTVLVASRSSQRCGTSFCLCFLPACS